MNSTKDMIKNKIVTFIHYKEGELWYTTQCGFKFPVPTDDVGTAYMNKTDRAILFMRWINKHKLLLETAMKLEVQ
tara:strand:- start:215 stop:439 length:225 start_codon:yes stop_codon:yes gene_type:complete